MAESSEIKKYSATHFCVADISVGRRFEDQVAGCEREMRGFTDSFEKKAKKNGLAAICETRTAGHAFDGVYKLFFAAGCQTR